MSSISSDTASKQPTRITIPISSELGESKIEIYSETGLEKEDVTQSLLANIIEELQNLRAALDRQSNHMERIALRLGNALGDCSAKLNYIGGDVGSIKIEVCGGGPDDEPGIRDLLIRLH